MFNLAASGVLQLEELALAFILSALVGIEREIRQKSAGLRTHTLVGVSAALFMLVSKYGFTDVLVVSRVVLDPSRVAAQVVSGIGFIGGGVIFMRRDVVRGLTTAASIWFTAALGMACGAGLAILALLTMLLYGIIMLAFPGISDRLPRPRKRATEIHISYQTGQGLLRAILIRCTELRFAIDRVRHGDNLLDWEDREGDPDTTDAEPIAARVDPANIVSLNMLVKGKRPISHLIASLSDMDGVREVARVDHENELD